MKIQIKSILGSLLYESDKPTIKEAINEANLSGADLRGADLYGADLYEADLYEADLSGANLRRANLREVNLRGADLSGANLSGANLRGADLYEADLYGANLYGANLRGAKNAEHVIAQTYIVAEGSIIGWKKCSGNMLVKLRIPEEAKRSNSIGRKCRAEFVDVLEIIDLKDQRKKPTGATSQHDSSVVYRVGERVTCHKWDDDRWNECAGGIHFFITRIEAENYN